MSGQGGIPRRAAVVSLPRGFVPPRHVVSGERFSGPAMTIILIVIFPFFAQTFYYLHEFPLPYLLSKAWPVLCAPLTLYALINMRLPAKHMFLFFFAYAIGFTPLNSIVRLGNGLTDAFITTVKVWPLTYYFALSALLVWLAPNVRRLRAVVVGLGYATFAIMILLWFILPTSAYVNDPALGKLLMMDLERGYRIYMPMFFGSLLLFYLTRSFMQQPRWLPALAVLIGFIALFSIYKQRTAIGGMFLVCVNAAVLSLAPQRRLLVIGLFLAVVPLGIGYLVVHNADGLVESLGGSLTVRQTSLALATNFLGDDPWRWLFGVGATTRFGSVTLADIFGNSQFFVADLGWIGIIFEYGLLGALLLAGLYGWGLYCVLSATRGSNDPLALAMSDYIIYMLVTSTVYSLVFTPGELGVVMALAVYITRAREPLGHVAPPAHRIRFTINSQPKGH